MIIDAECTHDGSIHHLINFALENWIGVANSFLNSDRLHNLEALQVFSGEQNIIDLFRLLLGLIYIYIFVFLCLSARSFPMAIDY